MFPEVMRLFLFPKAGKCIEGSISGRLKCLSLARSKNGSKNFKKISELRKFCDLKFQVKRRGKDSFSVCWNSIGSKWVRVSHAQFY